MSLSDASDAWALSERSPDTLLLAGYPVTRDRKLHVDQATPLRVGDGFEPVVGA